MSAKPPDKKGRSILSEMIASQARKRNPALGDMLAGYPLQPPIIQNNWFKDKTFYIDGYTFESCRELLKGILLKKPMLRLDRIPPCQSRSKLRMNQPRYQLIQHPCLLLM